MAIDTEAKRFRILDFLQDFGAPGLPTPPVGSWGAGERAAALWLYFGAAVVGPTIVATPSLRATNQAPDLLGTNGPGDLEGRVG